jgi:hypothetical protein
MCMTALLYLCMHTAGYCSDNEISNDSDDDSDGSEEADVDDNYDNRDGEDDSMMKLGGDDSDYDV